MTTTYEYTARDRAGKTIEGTLEGESPDAVVEQLQREGLIVFDVEEAAEGLFPKRISRGEVIYVTNQLAIMVDTGITLSTALGGIVEQETNPSLRKVLAELREAVEGGEDFSAALGRYPKLFDRTYCALVKASEATGSLGAMLDRIGGYLRKELETAAKVRAAMAYPAVMMLLAVGVTVFLLTYILPKFTPLFKSRGTELPAATKLVMGVSDAVMGHWYFWLAGFLALIAGALVARRTVAGRKAIDWLKIHAPIVGPLVRKVTISRSIRTLGTMLASGVPVLEAIRLAGAVSGNFFYEAAWKQVYDEVTGGRRICEVLRGNPLFPRVLVQMIASGEETGKLDYVLERVSTYYDGEVETAVKAATSLIEPLMICVMGAVVGAIGLALLLPIFSLSRQP
ncbi:MAG: type II secretion system F family protein [Planctomycetota bacterium]